MTTTRKQEHTDMIALRIKPSLRRSVQARARRLGVPRSEYIRLALTEKIERDG